MVEKKELRLLLVHGGRVSRALEFQPKRHSLIGRRCWKYHASCSVNLLRCRAEMSGRRIIGKFTKNSLYISASTLAGCRQGRRAIPLLIYVIDDRFLFLICH